MKTPADKIATKRNQFMVSVMILLNQRTNFNYSFDPIDNNIIIKTDAIGTYDIEVLNLIRKNSISNKTPVRIFISFMRNRIEIYFDKYTK